MNQHLGTVGARVAVALPLIPQDTCRVRGSGGPEPCCCELRVGPSLSGFRLTEPVGDSGGSPSPRVTQTDDIQDDYAARSEIRDWAGTNEDTAGEFDSAR